MGVSSAYMSVFHMCRASKGQKWVSDPLELELGIIVTPCKDTRTWACVLCKNKKYFNLWYIPPFF